MALKPKISLRQTQRLSLTPTLRQSLNILALPMTELITAIHDEAAENPMLKLETQHEGTFSGGRSAYDVATETVASTVSLGESLHQQITLMRLDDVVRSIAFYLIGDLDENGYLTSDIDDTVQALGLERSIVERAISAIQSCDPPGVGAKNLTECIFLQMIEAGIDDDRARLITKHLDLIAAEDWPILLRKTQLSEVEVHELVTLVRKLTPFPAARFRQEERPVSPEIRIERDASGQHRVALTSGMVPEITIDVDLLTRSKKDPGAREFAARCQARADSLISAVRFRNKTLLRISNLIVRHQHPFFSGRADHLIPLTRAEIADQLSLHASTVGRAMAGKYLEWSGLVYPLSFFTSSTLGAESGLRTSAYSAQQMIRRLVERETADTILSDEKIVKKLNADGVDITRRTVAKYRGCMNIPSSFERRRQMATRRTRPGSPGSVNFVKQ